MIDNTIEGFVTAHGMENLTYLMWLKCWKKSLLTSHHYRGSTLISLRQHPRMVWKYKAVPIAWSCSAYTRSIQNNPLSPKTELPCTNIHTTMLKVEKFLDCP